MKLSVAFVLLFAGLSKLIWIKHTSRFARDMGLFPKKIGAAIGFFMPLIELVTGIGLMLSNNPIINIVVFGIIMFFIAINIKSVIEKKEVSCFCYGKIIKTKFSKGGLIHYVYLLFALLISLLTIHTRGDAFIIDGYMLIDQVLIIGIAFFMFINGILIRLVLDKLT